MTTGRALLIGASQILAHVPDLVLHGSKPTREFRADREHGRNGLRASFTASLRSVEAAAAYLPNQIFIGAAAPRALTDSGRPWWSTGLPPQREGDWGLLFGQSEFLSALQRCDTSGLIELAPGRCEHAIGTRQARVVDRLRVSRREEKGGESVTLDGATGALARVAWGYPGDESLSPSVILENTAVKTTGALALADVLDRTGIDGGELDWVISCSEEAVGDRYQRGGGNMGKAIAEAVDAHRASGFDVKNFCAGPVPALVAAAALVETGVGETVAVVAGGSVAKLGMKFQGHLSHGMPILEDCLGGFAFLVQRNRGTGGPAIRLDSVGRHSVGSGGSNQQILGELVFGPLERLGLKVAEVDVFATELHNPELTEPQGSGDVPLRNYRMIAALAIRKGHLSRTDMNDFLRERCFAGFAPTQGHIASGICLVPHVLSEMNAGRVGRAQIIAKGSLFLGKMSALSDGASILIDA